MLGFAQGGMGERRHMTDKEKQADFIEQSKMRYAREFEMLSLRKIDSLYTHLTMSPKWEKTILSFISFYAMWIGIEIEYNPTVNDDRDPDKLDIFYVVEILFTVFFIVELWARLKAYKNWTSFFTEKERNSWNIFDLVLVVFMAAENFLMPFIEESKMVQDYLPRLTTLRLLRMIRLVRILIIVPELKMLINSLFAALRGVGSVGVLVALFM